MLLVSTWFYRLFYLIFGVYGFGLGSRCDLAAPSFMVVAFVVLIGSCSDSAVVSSRPELTSVKQSNDGPPQPPPAVWGHVPQQPLSRFGFRV